MKIYKNCNNKLTIVGTKDVDYIFSYSSLIGIAYQNTFILNEYFIKYSKTTGLHINTAKDLYSYFIPVKFSTFKELEASNFEKGLLNLVLAEDKTAFKIKAILEAKKDLIKTNNDYLNLINLLKSYAAVNPFNISFKELKSVNKELLSFKAGAVTFNILKTYTKGGRLKSIKINRIIQNSI